METEQKKTKSKAEQLFEAADAMIEQEFTANAMKPRGCFGTLLFNADDDICKDCEHFEACDAEQAKNRLDQLVALEQQVEIETASAEVDGELAELEAHKSAEAEREDEDEGKTDEGDTTPNDPEFVEPVEPVGADQSVGSDGLPDMKIKSRVAKGFDWNALVRKLVDARPGLYRDAAAIVKAEMPNVWESTTYSYLNKILTKLSEAKVVVWQDKARTITWLK